MMLEFDVPAEHPVYPDHFPGDPLVPGALLLSWMIRLVAPHYRITGIRQCKFLRPVRPADRLQWHLLESGTQLKIRCECAGQPVLQAVCGFVRPADGSHAHD